MQPLEMNGGSGQNRTADTGIFSPVLYRLSYRPTTLRLKNVWFLSNPDSFVKSFCH